MQGKWEGFTDEDLKSMCGKNKSKSSAAFVSQHSVENFNQKNMKEAAKIAKQNNSQANQMVCDTNASSKESVADDKSSLDIVEASLVKHEEKEESPNVSTVCLKIKNDVAYEVLRNEAKVKNESLSEFHFRQKMMEEQNRKKKELLAQALAERKKRTHAEANRLHKIQEELQKLDNLLSNDVSILRDQIEAASLEYTVAQKRFDKAEKEYLDAKLVLTGKLEKKELLTAHLCTIIEQNELRKAQKLSELMEKLQIAASDT
ncbi:RAB6-interacting golgin [Ischnura elegans]|uniref:RAB6-interacting golgin n=1 Tax=Ischnura elegans TaxID=197161 RepID=UPI001ED8B78A|nr:RAB6-interacting golgin [Ischnura elegans]